MKSKLVIILALVAALFLLTNCGVRVVKGAKGDKGDTGAQGPVGPQGPQGEPGQPGLSCAVIETTTGATIACEDGTIAQVADGSDGQDGTVVETIELCPHKTGGVFKEYALKIGGDLFAVYASGQKIGMAKLLPGEWQTTDGRKCKFTVNPDLSITY